MIAAKVFPYILAFFVGVVIMVLEVLGFRLLAPYFGYSVYVSGGLIGVVLLALAMGYYGGGHIADRQNNIDFLMKCVVAATVYQGIMLLANKPILRLLMSYGEVLGSLLASFVLFFPTMVLLSVTSPYLISVLTKSKLLVDTQKAEKIRGTEKKSIAALISDLERSGSISGQIYALSTAGSILGVFITTFVLLPIIGSKNTMILCFAILLLLVVMYYAVLKRKTKPFSLLLLPFIFLILLARSDPNVIHEKDSFYNLVRVVKQHRCITLELNQRRYAQSRYDPNTILINSVSDIFNIAPFFLSREITRHTPLQALILGMGGGTSVHQMLHFFPNMRIDAVEIDPEVVRVALKFFELEKYKNLNIVIDDSRPYVMKIDKKYDLVELDLYQGGPYIPFYLVTEEFFQQLRTVLTEDAIVTMNATCATHKPEADQLMENIISTLLTCFDEVFTVSLGRGRVLFATNNKLAKDDAKRKLRYYAEKKEFKELSSILGYAHKHLQQRQSKGVIFTDDKAPVEQLIHKTLARKFPRGSSREYYYRWCPKHFVAHRDIPQPLLLLQQHLDLT